MWLETILKIFGKWFRKCLISKTTWSSRTWLEEPNTGHITACVQEKVWAAKETIILRKNFSFCLVNIMCCLVKPSKDDGTFRENVITITYVWCLLHFRCCFYNLLLPYDDLRPCVHLKGFAGCQLICIWQLVISGHCRLLFSCIFPIHHTSVNILLFIGTSCQKLEMVDMENNDNC